MIQDENDCFDNYGLIGDTIRNACENWYVPPLLLKAILEPCLYLAPEDQ